MFRSFLKFFIPIALWLFSFRNILTGVAPFGTEPFALYAMVKFYLDHLRTGVFPLWNPFLLWGFPLQIIHNYFGVFNPAWLVTLLLNSVGLPLYQAFIYTIFAYFLIGQMGFYFLAKVILKDSRAAYIAFVFSLFSSMGIISIAQFNILLIFVPAVWFFYFLTRFCQVEEVVSPAKLRTSWLGMIFSLMLIMQSYLPIYFMIVLILAGLIFVLINPRHCITIMTKTLHFVREQPVFLILTLSILICSMLPAFWAYQSTVSHQVVLPCRQSGKETFTKGAAFTHYSKTNQGGLGSRMSWADLITNQDQMVFSNDGVFYVSGFAFLILIMGTINRLNKRIIFLLLFFMTLLFICLGDATPVHQFLFEHLFFFRLIRNLHFFLPFLLAAFILLVAHQAQLLSQAAEGLTRRWRIILLAFAAFVHAGCWVFLRSQENINRFTFETIIASFILCLITLFPVFKFNRTAQSLLLFLCIVLQPMSVLRAHNILDLENSTLTNKLGMKALLNQPHFLFQRGDSQFTEKTEDQKIEDFYWYYLSMSDAPYIPMSCQHGFPAYWAYYFMKNFPADVVRDYPHNKFALYDAIILHDEGSVQFDPLIKGLRDKTDIAFVAMDRAGIKNDLADFIAVQNVFADKQSQPVISGSESFRVSYFDANTIRFTTDFKQNKFLVYNDSFFEGWQARKNGIKIPLYRANVAFKGLRLTAGQHDYELTYHPAGGVWFPVLMILIFSGTLLFLIMNLCWDMRPKK